MHRLPQKANFQCPGCGFSQLEPRHLISTYCQSCGEYYEVRQHTPPPPELPPASRNPRAVACHRCGVTHHVSEQATNTMCPGCNAAIELGDMKVSGPTARPVDIRGRLTITPSGSLSSSWIICGAADVHGRIVGILHSEGRIRISHGGICACQITAPTILIERQARATFTHPIETEHLEVSGHLAGIIHCRGDVHVRRGGRLEAEVYARSVRVEKGGALLGTCHVNATQSPELASKIVSPKSPMWELPLCPA